ncbi:MAG: hypothetical protein Q7S33_04360 [Nanoarchaeota archaeon]|nr:hypothetical protein [Nanoarchaeota archaeon]
MEKVVHYTSKENWERIQESGFLLPKTGPNDCCGELSDRVKNMFKADSYLVCMPRPLDNGWVESGLMDYVLKYTTGEVALSVPILDRKKSFVREHAHGSSKRFMELWGEDLFKEVEEGRLDSNDSRVLEGENKYLESTVPLDEYDGSYLAPEIWLAQTTPVDKLTRI